MESVNWVDLAQNRHRYRVFLWMRWRTFGFNKIQGISGLGEELLDSEEEVCSLGSPQLNTMPWILTGNRTQFSMHAWPIILEPAFSFYVVAVLSHAEAKNTDVWVRCARPVWMSLQAFKPQKGQLVTVAVSYSYGVVCPLRRSLQCFQN